MDDPSPTPSPRLQVDIHDWETRFFRLPCGFAGTTLLFLYYLVILVALLLIYGGGDFQTAPFVYQGF